MSCSHKTETRAKVIRICRDYLNGSWKEIDPERIVLEQVTGGLSNYLYYCALPANVQPQNGEPTNVLVRFYGQTHGEGASDALLVESVIYALLSERKLGPKLYGVFPGGRLEEFIPSRPLKTSELADPKISAVIASRMALVHSLDVMPVSKEPSWLWDKMRGWMNHVQPTLAAYKSTVIDDNLRESEAIKSTLKLELETEMEWLRNYLTQLRSPVVFSHNDLQEGNILLPTSSKHHAAAEDDLVIVDFEYCSYNYQGFDFANHFCEYTYDYTADQYPNFTYTPSAMPSVDHQLGFIRCYLETASRESGNVKPSLAVGFQNETRLLREAECFMLASHFLWGLWGIFNALVSTIDFGYWEYARVRLCAYQDHKQHLLEKYGETIQDVVKTETTEEH